MKVIFKIIAIPGYSLRNLYKLSDRLGLALKTESLIFGDEIYLYLTFCGCDDYLKDYLKNILYDTPHFKKVFIFSTHNEAFEISRSRKRSENRKMGRLLGKKISL